MTRHIFNEHDDSVLNFLDEEGQSIEPDHYLPILPMVLVNGAEGIGTGWATSIPCYNPREIVENLRRMMKKQDPLPMIPWYKGFQGAIEPLPNNSKSFVVSGNFARVGDNELEITELPLGKWTREYKAMLEEKAQKGEVTEIREYHMENRVHFVVEIPKLDTMSDAQIIKEYKLQSSMSTTNLVLFTGKGKIAKYASELDILKEFFSER